MLKYKFVSPLLLILVIILISLPACNTSQSGADLTPPTTDLSSPTLPPDQSSTELPPPPPPPERPEHWNPKLDSTINQIIDAEEQGDDELLALAAQLGYIVDRGVVVVIECEPGQAEAVAEVVANLGAEIQGISIDTVGAVVPINKLAVLADEKSVRFVKLPFYAVPLTTS